APLFIDAGIDLCVRIGAEISIWACRPFLDAYAWLHVMRTHRLQQWPSRFVAILSFLSFSPATSAPNSAC
ncbi:hypothetical protein PIB30_090664, partial [Stylosanthes scabra]|nr:hypothetical protein [Stylosanthes scabra]